MPEDPVTDPIITNFVSSCGRCNKPVQWRVHEGSNGNTAFRGTICQMCIDYTCNWFKCYTPAYAYNDSKRFLERHLTRLLDPTAYPQQLTQAGAVLRLAPPALAPLPAAVTQVPCPTLTCKQKNGEPQRGNKNCVERMCKTCCQNTAQISLIDQTVRPYCQPHKAKGFEGDEAPNLPNHAPPIAPLIAPAPVMPSLAALSSTAVNAAAVETLLSVLHAQTVPPSEPSPLVTATPVLTPTQAILPPQAPSLSQATPPPSQASPPSQVSFTVSQPASAPIPVVQSTGFATHRRGAGPPSQRPRKPLAQPLLWGNAYDAAQEHKQRTQSLKASIDELAKQAKVLVAFSIWHTEGKPPFRWEESVMTYPNVRLAELSNLSRVLTPRLSGDAVLERLDTMTGYWKGMTIDTVMAVDSTQRTKAPPHIWLRIRQDPFTEWDEDACVDLASELRLAGVRQRKRAAEDAVEPPPVNKVARTSTALQDVSVARKTSQVQPPVQHQVIDGCSMLTPSREPRGRQGNESDWPFKYSVSQIVEGFDAMDALLTTEKLSKAEAFSRVYGFKWAKSTFYKYSKIWASTPHDLRQRFLTYRSTPEGSWRAFMEVVPAHIVEKASRVKGKPASSDDEQQSSWSSPPPLLKGPAPATHDDLEYIDFPSSPQPQAPHNSSVPPPGSIISPGLSTPAARGFSPSPTSGGGNPMSSWPMQEMSPLSSPSMGPLHLDFGLSREELDEFEDDPDADASSSDSDEHADLESKMLCSFCDEDLPTSPSPQLLCMRLGLDAVTYPERTRRNPAHREYETTAAFEKVHAYCLQHRQETAAHAARLTDPSIPHPINFASLPHRLSKIIPHLVEVALNPHTNEIYMDVKASITPNMSAKQMMEKLHKATAGYYGAKGYAILFRLLLHLFKTSFDAHWTLNHCLTTDSMIGMVLIPEAAVQFIQEDRGCDRAAAILCLRRTHTYGTITHPLDDEDTEVDTAVQHARSIATNHKNLLNTLPCVPKCQDCISASRRRLAMSARGGHHARHPATSAPTNLKGNSGDSSSQVSPSSGSSEAQVPFNTNLPTTSPRVKIEEIDVVIPPLAAACGLSASADEPHPLDNFLITVVNGKVIYELLSDDEDEH